MPITDAVKPYQFQPGKSGNPHGRKPLRHEVVKTCANEHFDPILEAIHRYRDPKTPNASKDYCLGLVADRLYPRLKSTEVKTDQVMGGQAVVINIVSSESPKPQIEDASVTDA